jgi:hypothetical protein
MIADLIFDPELRLVDGTVIRDRQDAIAFTRGLRGRRAEGAEVLRLLERATKPEEVETAAQRFRSWINRLELLQSN